MKRASTLAAAAAAATLAGAGALLAATGAPAAWTAPASEHRVSHAGGYQFTVHPAFSRRAIVRDADGSETELHRQSGVYNLPAGRASAPSQHQIRLDGGALARDLGITVNDPKHQVARITVELYGPDHVPGRSSPVVQTLVVENGVGTCPPDCDGHGPPGSGGGRR
ncbi:MAG TPA: hypothetical protein VFS20_15160 [Longimicrobium sp.]|nr:hypothetical protein [Longimicrobium sp.]